MRVVRETYRYCTWHGSCVRAYEATLYHQILLGDLLLEYLLGLHYITRLKPIKLVNLAHSSRVNECT